jgi:hypothetical protein
MLDDACHAAFEHVKNTEQYVGDPGETWRDGDAEQISEMRALFKVAITAALGTGEAGR